MSRLEEALAAVMQGLKLLDEDSGKQEAVSGRTGLDGFEEAALLIDKSMRSISRRRRKRWPV